MVISKRTGERERNVFLFILFYFILFAKTAFWGLVAKVILVEKVSSLNRTNFFEMK